MSYVVPYNKQDEVLALAKDGKPISAIKLLRDSNPGLQLIDAKNIVESWLKNIRPVPPSAIARDAAADMQSLHRQMADAKIIQRAIGKIFDSMPLPPSDIDDLAGKIEYIESIHNWRAAHGYPVPESPKNIVNGVDVGEG